MWPSQAAASGVDGLKQEDVLAKRRTGLWMASQQQSPANTPEAQRGEDVGLIPREDFHRGAGPGHLHECTEPWRRTTEKSAILGGRWPHAAPTVILPCGAW